MSGTKPKRWRVQPAIVRATATVKVSEALVLRPASMVHLEALLGAAEEDRTSMLHALPWLEEDQPFRAQFTEYLEDVAGMGRAGMAHNWVIVERGGHPGGGFDAAGERFAGIIAFNEAPQLKTGHWDLGYWVRPCCRRRGFAGAAIDAALEWIGQGGPTCIEFRCDPANAAGMATALATCARWKGHRHPEADCGVLVRGKMIHHEAFLIPRLPLPGGSPR